jgi:hypothetical protein
MYSELDTANYGIVTIARNKLYAIVEMTEGTRGRQKLDNMLGDELQNAIQMKVAANKVGYAWGLPACEYRATFPVRPEVHTIEANQQRTQRASTPDGNIPTITAACWPLPPGGAPAAISQVKTSGMRALEESGVKNLRLQEKATQKGYELDVTGEKSVDGIDTIVSSVFYLGETSLLEVTITESASVRSLTATQFLDWIDRPSLKR